MVNDHFSQASIDFFLGNVTSMVFDEFETEMGTKDPAVSMVKMREQAIELCQKRVVADDKEEFIGGWVLLSPHRSDSIRSLPMDEVVVLLTDVALYLCRFNWNLDKVSSFDRVDLAHVVGVRFGTYITSTLAPVHMDEMKNVGLVVSYQPGKEDITRTNTRTLTSLTEEASVKVDGVASAESGGIGGGGNSGSGSRPTGLAGLLTGKSQPPAPVIRKLAFKAPYSQSSIAVSGGGPRMTELQQIVTICAEIDRLVSESQPRLAGRGSESIIEKADIISLEEAKKSTGLFEHLGHTIKQMVWA
jgi:hypothetical protein